MNLENIPAWAAALKAEARQVLSQVESSRDRRFTLDSSYRRLGRLSIKQDDLFRQALRCVEFELYRAAHVMAWAAFMDLLHDRLAAEWLSETQSVRPKWKINRAEDLRNWSDHQVIETSAEVKLITKIVMKGLHGLLNKRNECAHPEDYYPGLNDTLGYIDELFKRVERIRNTVP